MDSLRAGLSDRNLAVRRESLLALVRLGDPSAKPTVERWLTGTDADALAARDLAIRCCQELDLREHIPIIRTYARGSGPEGPSHSEVIQIAAIVALSQWGDEASRPDFEVAAGSGVVRLQRAGKAALARVDRSAGR